MDSMFPMIFIFRNQKSIPVDFVEPSVGWFWFWFSKIFLGKNQKNGEKSAKTKPKRCKHVRFIYKYILMKRSIPKPLK